MNRDDLLSALRAKGKPTPFTTPLGAVVNLSPLSYADRVTIQTWWRDHESTPGSGMLLIRKYLCAGLRDADGKPLFTEDEIDSLDLPASELDAIADEVACRAGLMRRENADPKAQSATTAN